jgi:flagellar basal-body rod modification protein FlgD
MTSLAVPNAASSVNAASVAASSTANSGSNTSSGSGSASTLTQSDFLQLLTAQLQYQSPLNPADPTEMASEFAQISTVNGIDKLNTQISDLQSSTAASQMGQAAGLVGKQVAVLGDTLTANSSGSATGAFNLTSAASDVNVTVLNQNGTVAGTMDLGALPAGQQSFQWTNGSAGQNYTYEVSATNSSGGAVQTTQYSVYTVEGVNLTGSTPTLNVEGYADPLYVSSVQTVLGAS